MSNSSAPAATRPLGAALLIGVLLLLAAAVRSWGLGAQALWHDELCSLNSTLGHHTFSAPPLGVLLPYPPRPGPDEGLYAVLVQTHDNHPPVYFLALRGWIDAFGSGATAMRSLSVLVSVLTGLLGALLAGTLAGRRAALVAALLFALAPIEFRYAQEARPYALTGTCAMLSTLALACLHTGRGRRALLWAVYVIAIVAAIATHYSGVLVPMAHLLWFLIAGRPVGVRPPLPVILALALGLAPVCVLMVKQYEVRRSEKFEGLTWLAGPANSAPAVRPSWIAERARMPFELLALGGGIISGPQSWPAKAAVHALLVSVLILIGLRAGWRQASLVVILALAAPLTLAAVDTVFGTHSLTVPRYALISASFIWVAAALGLSRLRGWPFALALLLVVAGQADGTVRSRLRETIASNVEKSATVLNMAGCDERDLVIIAGDHYGHYQELNHYLTGTPFEMVIGDDGRFDENALRRPWRHVFLLAANWRDDSLRSRVAEGRTVRQTIPMAHLTSTWFTTQPPR